VERNAALSAFENGFTVDGNDGSGGTFSGTRLRQNKASSNAGQGFAVIDNARQTVLTGNSASANSVDYCDAGLETLADQSNKFGTTAPQCTITRGDPATP